MTTTLAQHILSDFQDEVNLTRTLLAAVPEDKWDYKPHEKSFTLGKLVGHLVEGPEFCGMMVEPEMDFQSMPEFKPFEPANMAAAYEKLDEVSKTIQGVLADRDDAFMTEAWTMRSGDKVIWETKRHDAFRSMAIHHSIHHRAQLGMYLRLLDVPVPPVYGPTADVTDLF